MKEKQYLFVVEGTEKVRAAYTVIASSEEEAIQKVNDGDYLDCDLGDVVTDDIIDPFISSKDEVDAKD